MENFALPRLDKDAELRLLLRPYCRIMEGEIWTDPSGRHRIGCLDASDRNSVLNLMNSQKAALAIQDPPYNFIAFNSSASEEFVRWSSKWIDITGEITTGNSSLYVWLGADHKNHMEPLPEFMLMMKKSIFKSRNFITMRNQRGYGTMKNWMSIRQELLYYIKGDPVFNIEAVYTTIPKVVKGYYKEVQGRKTENMERSRSEFIRSGNVWIDIQQVFYRMEENVNGCYAQKPLKAIERIVLASSSPGDIVTDLFSHAGTTLLACEKHGRHCFTADIEPVYSEITLRRLERFRQTGKTGWQNSNPFANEILTDKRLAKYIKSTYRKAV